MKASFPSATSRRYADVGRAMPLRASYAIYRASVRQIGIAQLPRAIQYLVLVRLLVALAACAIEIAIALELLVCSRLVSGALVVVVLPIARLPIVLQIALLMGRVRVRALLRRSVILPVAAAFRPVIEVLNLNDAPRQ